MNEEDLHLIELLQPRQSNKIMDLVEKVGIDVSRWGYKQGGIKVKIPAANPNYCYEWAFGGDGEPTALCVWHRSLQVSGGVISFNDNLRHLALDLERKSETKDREVRSRARDQAKRARKFDIMLQHAFRKSQPVRIILLEGDRSSTAALGLDASKVKFRLLDSEYWYTHDYADDGSFRLVRTIPPISLEASPSPEFVDQFYLPEILSKRNLVASIYVRNSAIRQAVLERAAGICECCGALGFKMSSGAVFLETHHVIPLSEDGPDCEWNVVAICPNDHREAHFGEDREKIRDQLIAFLARKFPIRADMLHSQAR